MIHGNFVRGLHGILSSVKYLFFNHGIRVAIDEILNQSRVWNWHSENKIDASGAVTSISDGTDYIAVCKSAYLFDATFKRYKSCAQYRDVLEHCSYDLGLKYLEFLPFETKVVSELKKIAWNDLGRPFRYTYKNMGRLSPTQIRYAKVLQDLTHLFGPLNKRIISEIGVGYGGQAIQILNLFNDASYRLFDLEWPAKLSLKNIEKTLGDSSKNVTISDWKIPSSSDLVISNYAFSELTRETQETYLENVIADSRMGYVIYNHLHDNSSDSLTAKEFAERIKGSQIFQEIPLTYPGNCLVVWGHNTEALPKNLFVLQDF